MGPFPPHRRRSELPPYSGLAKWVSASPVPWICLCHETQLRPKAPIQDGNQELQVMYPTDRQETVTGTQELSGKVVFHDTDKSKKLGKPKPIWQDPSKEVAKILDGATKTGILDRS
ncbi:hypothetical protein C2G38_2232756 [Gigaspora rosea]|uniref:Uncharacterized protein n=1 Tax=Gigaspora rosea TaxID=44941 RepID=A0A397TRP0_9GLOM|nr:hypothetical protein C2G38_2232756 [Gigaspora rosea]